MNDFVKNLIYFGFYKNCDVFFEDKSKFYSNFFNDCDFIGAVEEKFRDMLKGVKTGEQEIKWLNFTRIKNWMAELNTQ